MSPYAVETVEEIKSIELRRLLQLDNIPRRGLRGPDSHWETGKEAHAVCRSSDVLAGVLAGDLVTITKSFHALAW